MERIQNKILYVVALNMSLKNSLNSLSLFPSKGTAAGGLDVVSVVVELVVELVVVETLPAGHPPFVDGVVVVLVDGVLVVVVLVDGVLVVVVLVDGVIV